VRRRPLILGVAAVAGLLVVAYLAFSAAAWDRTTAVVGSACVDERPDQTPANFVAAWRVGEEPEVDATPYRFDAEDVTFARLTTGIDLRAWWAPPHDDAGPVVIVVHGRGSCRRDAVTLLPAGMLARHGFGILALDLRDHGESDREDGHWAGGVDEWQDVLGAWRWLRDRGYAADRIGLYGASMGAGSVAYALGHEPAVAAAFLDSPYADILSASTAYAEDHGTPGWMVPGALFIGGVISGDNLLGDSPARIVREELAGRPLFIVHGDADDTIAVAEGRALAQAATDGGTPVDPWILPGVEHVQSAFVEPAEYERRLTGFFAEALAGG
jgi:dipeptidyl aminopeptidase/acylaminoacyl peptidase